MKKRTAQRRYALVFGKGIALELLGARRFSNEESEKPHKEETDYSDPESWFKIPEITKDVDTFYIYPTVYINFAEDAPEYAPVGDAAMTAGVKMMYTLQANVFEESTNLFIPFYRQANLKTATRCTSFTNILKDHFPQQDINAALDYYFEKYNNGRPFILAGHSQGSALIRLILKEYFAKHPEYYERMIAAYVLGYSITGDDLAGYPHLRFAQAADDTGVIVSWNVEGPGNKGCRNAVVLNNAISINPLNWKRDDTYASAEENLGSFVPDWKAADNEGASLEQRKGIPEFKIADVHADARVDLERGTVVCTTKEFPFIKVGEGLPAIFGPESFHNGDYCLYYKNIQENVKTRIEAFRD